MADGKYQVPLYKTPRIELTRHQLSPNPDDSVSVKEWLQQRPRPWAIDLFSGAGGLSLGLESAGFSVVAAADSDKSALETHAANINGLVWNGDLSDPTFLIDKLRDWGIDKIDLLAGGPPCQPFSRAGVPKIGNLVESGNRQEHDKRIDLWRSFFTFIDHLEPKALLLENVPGLAQAQDGAVLSALISELTNRGYTPYVEVLDASNYRVPQTRSRLFIVAFSENKEFSWPVQKGRKSNLRQAIGDLPEVPGGMREETQPYSGPPIGILGKILRKGMKRHESKLIRDHITRGVRPDDATIFSLMKPGDTYQDVPEEYRRYRSDIFKDKYYRLDFNAPSRTITAHISKDGYWYIHPTQHRTLSIREAARIQTFPDKFRFAGSQTERFNQIGNAVPPLLAAVIGSSIKSSLLSKSKQILKTDNTPSTAEANARCRLGDWFAENGRVYPWRNSELTAWQFLLIEICLRRTKADQVANVATKLLELAATPDELLSNLDEVRRLLDTLGLNHRQVNLIDAAILVRDELGGVVPKTWQSLRKIPGVGDYIASAVLCFAYNKPMVLLDTNTKRLARRITGEKSDSLNWRLRMSLLELSGPQGPNAKWNYSLLDLGALVCTARNPKCQECPIQDICATAKMELGP